VLLRTSRLEGILQAFLRALRNLGWMEGRNVVIEYRWAEGHLERLPGLAQDLVRRKVDVIVAPAASARQFGFSSGSSPCGRTTASASINTGAMVWAV